MSENLKTRLSQYILADGFDMSLDLENSYGSYIVDKATGKKYVDFFTCFASMPLGFNHKKLNNQEFKDKIFHAAINKPSISDLYPEEYFTFIDTFFKLAVPKEFKHSFFIEGGALAVENALKVAFDWKTHKVLKRTNEVPIHLKVISFAQAFHGRSGYTLTLTNTDPVKTMYFPKFDWIRVTNPKLHFSNNPENLALTMQQEDESIKQIMNAIKENEDKIAAIIIEPIQAEGGDNHFRDEFLQKLRKIADENEILLIFDEVQTGVGMTGTWWYFQQTGVTPDIAVFGKKMQVCGLIATDRVDDIANNVFHTSSRINSTWGGNLVDMIRCTRYLEIIAEENLIENSRIVGEYLLSEINKLVLDFPILSNARGKGLMCAFDMLLELRKDFISKAYENGLMILTCGVNSIRFRPQLGITKSEIDEGIAIIRKSLTQLLEKE